MSLFGSLSTSVSALNAQSQAISMTANNIANVSTVGYKGKTAGFTSLVTTDSRNASYTSGSVDASTLQHVAAQGGMQQTGTSTNIGVSGNGFFVVQKSPTGFQEKYYTRAGEFTEDASGYLKNTAGFFLMGWPLDTSGALPPGVDDLSSLVPVDVAFLGGMTRPTASTSMSLNLDASEPAEDYPIPTAAGIDFSRTLRVYDSLGAGEDLKISYTHHDTPTANSTSGIGGSGLELDTRLTSLTGVTAGQQISVTVGSASVTYTITSTGTVQDFLNAVNGNTAVAALGVAQLKDGEIRVVAKSLTDTVTVANVGAGTSATAMGFTNNAAPTAPSLLLTAGGTYNLSGWWQIDVSNATTGEVLKSGSINFNSDGTINATEDADGDIKFTAQNIDWANGSGLQDIDVNIRNITQFAGTYNVISTTQDGAELGLRTGVEIASDGRVIAKFSNGQTAAIYKIPLATFTNANGLSEISGNAYTQTVDSGSFNLKEAGQGGSGLLEGASLESSTVDIAEEFTKMIVTQRAYSAATKVVKTVDDMTEELLRLR